MRPSLRVARAVASLSGAAALLAYAFAGPSAAEDETVQANNQNQFTPAEVTIDPGDTVTWQYAGGFGHTVTSTSANWTKDTPLGPPAATLQTSYLFDRPGTYTYVCTTHESVGMRGIVVVRGSTASPRPTSPRPTSPRPTSPRPTATRTSAPPSESPSASPSPSAASATPPVLPSVSVPPGETTPTPPQPSVVAEPTGTPVNLGSGGLTPPPPTGRAKGLPVMLALLLIGGVGSAEVRALLAHAPD